MIKIYNSKPIRNWALKSLDDVKGFVPATELWYSYEIKLDDIIDKLRFAQATLTYNDLAIDTNIIYYDNIILASTHCSINDIAAACINTEYNIPNVSITKMGYIDEVYRKKYISTPINGYWDYGMNPILLVKRKQGNK